MASSTVLPNNPHRGKGDRGQGRKRANQPRSNAAIQNLKTLIPAVQESSDAGISTTTQDDNVEVCWICAEPVKYYSVPECNHRTCHVCALRLRALYKKLDCTFCKEPQHSVVFTVSPDAPFSAFAPDSIQYKDSKLSIFFETREMMEDALILLRYNCPVGDCDSISNGWADLKLHVRAVHGKLMCDLCIKMKRVFAHEHTIYSPNVLGLHLPSLTNRLNKSISSEKVDGGVHPLCEFCRECFFDDDELYAHMREKHEECFLCKRNEIMHQYFQDYEALDRHFMQGHHPCMQAHCLARKFVVFGTAMDLKAHTVEEHGADMSSRDKKDARRVEARFEFERNAIERPRRERLGAHSRDRNREPPPHVVVSPNPARQPVNNRRRDFGTNLTPDNPITAEIVSTPFQSTAIAEADPAVSGRYAAFLSRLRSLAPNPQGAANSVGLALRSYRASESAARDLILTILNVLDLNLDGTASIINVLVDMLDDEGKKQDLLSAWNGFKIEQRNQFPELGAPSIGNDYAGITSGRVINAKHSTTTRSTQPSRQVLDRVAQAAGSSSRLSQRPPDRFPLWQFTGISAPLAKPPAFRQVQHVTPWSASASGASSSRSSPAPTRPEISNGSKTVTDPLSLSKTAFPELPQSSVTRAPKGSVNGNQSLRNIRGEAASPSSAWGAPGHSGATSAQTQNGAETASSGKGKKGKGKQKQTLFTLGSFPT